MARNRFTRLHHTYPLHLDTSRVLGVEYTYSVLSIAPDGTRARHMLKNNTSQNEAHVKAKME